MSATTQLNSKGQAEGNSIAGSFQLNHYENTITQSQTQAGDIVSVLPLDQRAHPACPPRWEKSPLRACAHLVRHTHCKHNHFNSWEAHSWLKKWKACPLTKTILAFFQKRTVPPLRYIFLWNNVAKWIKLDPMCNIKQCCEAFIHSTFWPCSGFYKQELTVA